MSIGQQHWCIFSDKRLYSSTRMTNTQIDIINWLKVTSSVESHSVWKLICVDSPWQYQQVFYHPKQSNGKTVQLVHQSFQQNDFHAVLICLPGFLCLILHYIFSVLTPHLQILTDKQCVELCLHSIMLSVNSIIRHDEIKPQNNLSSRTS